MLDTLLKLGELNEKLLQKKLKRKVLLSIDRNVYYQFHLLK